MTLIYILFDIYTLKLVSPPARIGSDKERTRVQEPLKTEIRVAVESGDPGNGLRGNLSDSTGLG